MQGDKQVDERTTKSLSMLTLRTLTETIRLANQFDNMSMMGQAVKQSCGQAFIAKDLNPISELEVGGDDQSETFIKFGTESEKGLFSFSVARVLYS